MGNIIKVVAVFEIHMLINQAESINPKMILLAEFPVIFNKLNENLLCNPDFSSAKANKNPPKNKKINLSPNGAQACSIVDIPNNGNNIIGNKAVTAIGTVSINHQLSIQTIMANVRHTLIGHPIGFIHAINSANNGGNQTEICLFI